MAITTQDQLIAAMASGKVCQFNKGSNSVSVGGFYTGFRWAGTPGAGSIPGTAAGNTLDRTSTGALNIPAPSNTTYFTGFQGTSTTAGTWMICDRLVETGTLSGTVTTAQTVNSTALPSRASAATDVELWLDIHTALGTTASATVTASYTNSSGTSGRTATLIGGIPASGGGVNRQYPMALQAGDTGVQSVQSVTSTTSTTTAGAFGVTLRRTLLIGGNVATANVGWVQGYAETDLQICPDNACLELLLLTNSAGSGALMGAVGLAQG